MFAERLSPGIERMALIFLQLPRAISVPGLVSSVACQLGVPLLEEADQPHQSSVRENSVKIENPI